MLTSEGFALHCERLGLSSQTQAILATIRSSPPSRRVGGGRKNVHVRYASRKMGVVIQAESHKNEFAGVYEMEHDPTVLEYFDQPPPITLHYQAKNGRAIGVLHTPDYFVIRSDSAGWEEWKTEEDLLRLAEKMPNRYFRGEDGQWHCPPGECVAEPLGFYYRIRSSAEISWILLRNLSFLEDYLREDCPAVQEPTKEAVLAQVRGNPGIVLRELITRVERLRSDDIYTLLVQEQLYVDVYTVPLSEPERVHIFCDEETARAWAVTLAETELPSRSTTRAVLVQAGAPVVWDGRPWTIVNVGETTTTLLDEKSAVIELLNARFEALVLQGKIIGLAVSGEQASLSEEALERIMKANKDALAEANGRYAIIKPVLEGHRPADTTTPARTIRDWAAKYREAAQTLGCGYIGLLSNYHRCGNRLPRLPEEVVTALNDFIEKEYETHKQKRKREVYGEFVMFCRKKGLVSPPSYRLFAATVKRRPRYEQMKKRAGRRAAYPYEPMYWELTFTLPRHGDRPLEIVHIDHTQLDVELVDSRTRRNLGRPWATFLTDAFSRRLLAVYLTFDEPSYRSCMMVLRECVHRHGRLPQVLVVDGGKEFGSTYFETLLARYECTKKTRPAAKPRYGSVVERLFGTANTTFVHNLAGNTQVTRNVRQVTKSVDPRRHATWTLGTLYARLREWAYEVYDTQEHPALGQTPREAFAAGILTGGDRPHRLIPYDDDFILFTLPTTPKGTALVQPNLGVKINYLYYWAKGDAFRDPEVEKTRVSVRYDPYDVGHAYVFVKGRWVECISEHYARFKGRTEREVLLASEELRKRNRRHGQQFTLTAAKLAEFITSVEAEEALLDQRRHDEEARAVLSLMEGTGAHAGEEEVSIPTQERSASPEVLASVATSQAVVPALDPQRDDDIYEDY